MSAHPMKPSMKLWAQSFSDSSLVTTGTVWATLKRLPDQQLGALQPLPFDS